jgi:hypothetical protein
MTTPSITKPVCGLDVEGEADSVGLEEKVTLAPAADADADADAEAPVEDAATPKEKSDKHFNEINFCTHSSNCAI